MIKYKKPNQKIVLLVEDNPNDIILIKRAFRNTKVGIPVQVVENGEEAITYFIGNGKYTDRTRYPLPTFVLLDLKLPRKPGFEVLAWIKQQPKLKHIPIAILTSSNRPSDISRAYNLGADSYLIKPVSFNTLVDIIKELKIN